MKKLAAAAALTGAAALITPTLALPADAQTVTIHDRAGDAHGSAHDLKYVRVRYGPRRIYFRIQWRAGDYSSDFEDIYIDTDPKRPGPEVDVSLYTETGWWSGDLVRNWSPKSAWKSIPGGGKYHEGTSGKGEFITFSARRGLVRRKGHAQPQRIRVSVNDVWETDYVWDSAPGHRKWSRWIHWK